MALEIKTIDDPAVLLAINNAAVPDVGPLTLEKAEWMVQQCVAPGLALLDGRPAGVLVVMSDDCGYNSDYYRWFTDRYSNFLYIDRVVVADWARKQGVARELYQLIDAAAQAQGLAIVSDVYSEPPNVPSLNLHHAMGFKEVGYQFIPSINKMTAKLMKYPDNAKGRRPNVAKSPQPDHSADFRRYAIIAASADYAQFYRRLHRGEFGLRGGKYRGFFAVRVYKERNQGNTLE